MSLCINTGSPKSAWHVHIFCHFVCTAAKIPGYEIELEVFPSGGRTAPSERPVTTPEECSEICSLLRDCVKFLFARTLPFPCKVFHVNSSLNQAIPAEARGMLAGTKMGRYGQYGRPSLLGGLQLL